MGSSSRVEWRPVVGYEGVYEVSNDGQVKRVAGGQGARPGIRKQGRHPNGYMQIALSMNNRTATKKVHRLVAEAFIGPCPEGMELCHNNDDPGDNRVENLRWDTHKANCVDRANNGKPKKSPKLSAVCKNGLHPMTPENVRHEGRWRICLACRAAKNKRHAKGYDPSVMCKNGHPRTDTNVYITPRGNRECRDCRRAIDNKRRSKKVAA